MGKKSKPPKAPNYKQQAEATAASNQQAQTFADWANRPDQVDMYGNKTSWQANAQIDPATGKSVNKWTQQVSLSPQQQQALDQQQAIQTGLMGTAQGMLGRANEAVSKDFDWAGLQKAGDVVQGGQGLMSGLDTGSLGAMPQADAQERMRIENALFDRMAPQHQQAQQGLEAKLANMGLTRGSAQWNREAQRLGDQQSRERFNAMEMGGQEMQRMFGMGMQGRQQGFSELMGAGQFQNAAQAQQFGQQQSQANYQNQLRQQQIAEQQLQRQMPLNELNAFMSGQQVQGPQFGDFNRSENAGGVNYSGAAQNQYNAAMNSYNAQQQQSAGLMGGLGSLAGTAIKTFGPALMASDIRLKSNIVRVGTHPIGVGVYEYDIFGRRERGVIAQELQQVAPDRVYTHSTGYLLVNYEGL